MSDPRDLYAARGHDSLCNRKLLSEETDYNFSRFIGRGFCKSGIDGRVRGSIRKVNHGASGKIGRAALGFTFA
jgi:hypothetical protein